MTLNYWPFGLQQI